MLRRKTKSDHKTWEVIRLWQSYTAKQVADFSIVKTIQVPVATPMARTTHRSRSLMIKKRKKKI